MAVNNEMWFASVDKLLYCNWNNYKKMLWVSWEKYSTQILSIHSDLENDKAINFGLSTRPLVLS